MRSNRLRLRAEQVVAGVGALRAIGETALRDHLADGRGAGPVVAFHQPADVVADRRGALLGAPVALLNLLMRQEFRRFERIVQIRRHVLVHRSLVAFERQRSRCVGDRSDAFPNDCRGNLLSTPRRGGPPTSAPGPAAPSGAGRASTLNSRENVSWLGIPFSSVMNSRSETSQGASQCDLEALNPHFEPVVLTDVGEDVVQVEAELLEVI